MVEPAVKLPDPPKPENAKQAVLMVKDDHNYVVSRPDITSTDGIKRNITALWAAIDRLAAYVDGDKPDAPAKATPKPAAPYPTTPAAV